MNSLTEENYLKALFKLSEQTGAVNVAELSRALQIKMPTVNSMIRKLAAKKLVKYQVYQPIVLTEKGRKAAGLIIRKHRLTEMFLVQKMGFGWDEVHEIAEQLEHIQSALLFDKMDSLLGFPRYDPHGSPIPDKAGKVEWLKLEKLADAKAGDVVVLTAVTDSSSAFLQHLNEKGLYLGIVIRIDNIAAYDQSMQVTYGTKKLTTLSQMVCDKLLIERKKDKS